MAYVTEPTASNRPLGPNDIGVARVARVIIDLSSSYNRHTYSYLVPAELVAQIKPGVTVVVPVRATEHLGYVVNISEDTAGIDGEEPATLKPILEVVRGASPIPPEQLELCRWISEHYLCGPNESLKLILPSGMRHRLSAWIEYKNNDRAPGNDFNEDSELTWLVDRGGQAKLSEIEKAFGRPAVARLIDRGAVTKFFALDSPTAKPKLVEFAAFVCDATGILKGPKQRALLSDLKIRSPQPTRQLLERHDTSRATLKNLVSKGLIGLFEKTEEREYDTSFTNQAIKKIDLNDDQTAALARINTALKNPEKRTFLLEGVTGSGKTEVYIRAAAECLSLGRSAIFLVPEIALLPQLAERLSARFGKQVAVIHSGVKAGERVDAVRAVAEGRKRIIVGARSALFAPVQNLGLVVIDEEHETSYKQNSTPRYDARAVAVKLSELHGAVVVLGSATPSLETRLRANEDGGCLRLVERAAGLHFPDVKLVDMRQEVGKGNYSIFSEHLVKRLRAVLDAGHKAILLMNRRGFANFTLCRHCGYVPECDHCSVSMTYHRSDNWLRCHHCGAAKRTLESCPKCGKTEWRYTGIGTQRVESDLKELFADAEVVRMDADTTARHRAHHDQLLHFHRSKRAILLGTQMVAKGLDFPEVALVGIINADTALNLPDFRAAERTAQLLIQVSGRSGRGSIPGEVLVQTFAPDNYAIRSVIDGYDNFCVQELEQRHQLTYPPFASMINIIFSGRDRSLVDSQAERISTHLKAEVGDLARLLGPAPAPIERIKGFWRYHLVLTATDPEKVKDILRRNEILAKGVSNLRIIIDVDPVWLL